MENMLKEVAATNYRFVSGVDGATLKSKAGFVTIDNVTSSKESFLCHYILSPFPFQVQPGRPSYEAWQRHDPLELEWA